MVNCIDVFGVLPYDFSRNGVHLIERNAPLQIRVRRKVQRRADVDVRRTVGEVRFQHRGTVCVVLCILRPNERHRVEVDALEESVIRAQIAKLAKCCDAGLVSQPILVVCRIGAVGIGGSGANIAHLNHVAGVHRQLPGRFVKRSVELDRIEDSVFTGVNQRVGLRVYQRRAVVGMPVTQREFVILLPKLVEARKVDQRIRHRAGLHVIRGIHISRSEI